MTCGRIEANCRCLLLLSHSTCSLLVARYLVLEFVEGGELFGYITQHGRLEEPEAVRLLRQMLAGLSHCHRYGICHRDLKPENILIDGNRNVKIVDFGFAALQPANKTLKTACGSPHYAAPEVVKAKSYNGSRADIWSCGVILYAMSTGTLPFNSDDYREVCSLVLKGDWVFPAGIDLSEDMMDLIERMLQYNPSARISVRDIWKHPLLMKYGYLDTLDPDGKPYIGPPPPLTSKDCGPPLRTKDDIDQDILDSLQHLWNGSKRADLMAILMNDA